MFKVLGLQVQVSMSQMSKDPLSVMDPNSFYFKGFHSTMMNICAKRTVGYKEPNQSAFWFSLSVLFCAALCEFRAGVAFIFKLLY